MNTTGTSRESVTRWRPAASAHYGACGGLAAASNDGLTVAGFRSSRVVARLSIGL